MTAQESVGLGEDRIQIRGGPKELRAVFWYNSLQMEGRGIRSCIWSSVSLVLSVSPNLVVFSVVEFLYSRGAWDPESSFAHRLRLYTGLSVLASLVLAIIGLSKDTRRWPKFVALAISLLALLL